MRFPTVAIVSLAGAAIARPIADTDTPESGILKDLEGLTKTPLRARALASIESEIEKITGTGGLNTRAEEKDPLHEALVSIAQSLHTRQVEEVEEIVGKTIQPLVARGDESSWKAFDLPSLLPGNGQTDVVDELTQSLALREVASLQQLTDSLTFTKRDTDIVKDLTDSLSLGKREEELVQELTESLPFPTERQEGLIDELTKSLQARELDIVKDFTNTVDGLVKPADRSLSARDLEVLKDFTNTLEGLVRPADKSVEARDLGVLKLFKTNADGMVEPAGVSIEARDLGILKLFKTNAEGMVEPAGVSLNARELPTTMETVPEQGGILGSVLKSTLPSNRRTETINTPELDVVGTLEDAL